MGALTRVEMALLGQRGHLFPWAPVCLACGIGLYFGIPFEPKLGVLPYLGVFTLGLMLAAHVWRSGFSFLLWAAVLFLSGFSVAMLRAHLSEKPVLDWRFYGAVEGRVVGVDRSGSGAVRLVLSDLVLDGVRLADTPERVRVSLHGEGGSAPLAGARVIVTAHLSPPGGPVEPGGFDFQRHAWFQKLGGVGYARTPLLLIEPPGRGQTLLRARLFLSQKVQEDIGGEAGAFVAAIMTGDRSGISQETLTSLRTTNLAHLLAISGLHMGLLTGFVFAAFRICLNLWPWLGLRIPVKKISAGLALVVASGYLGLSGGNVATERAFIMVAVALLAVIADRRVMSLRAVALAAMIVLVLWPEALLGPGFQMSFAATTALVVVFRWLRDAEIGLGPAWLRPLVATALSSAVAGAATAPIAAAHFNQFAHFGLIANLLSVPLMGLLVMPSALVGALLMPFGLETPALWLAGKGVNWILGVADRIAALEGARGAVVSPDWRVLPLLAIGFCIVAIWQGRFRFAGLAPAAFAALVWSQTERPAILIAEDGALVGVLEDEGRALSRERGAGFVAQNWLENDGDPVDQAVAAKRWSGLGGRWKITHVTRKSEIAELICAADEIVVTSHRIESAPGPCMVFERARMARDGSIAVFFDEDGNNPRAVGSRGITGERLWNRRKRQ